MQGGYILVDGVAEDVLIIHPAIVDLNVQAPNNVRNEAAARDMLSEWAEILRLALDEARTVVSKH